MLTIPRIWDDTMASHSGFLVSKRTRTISNLLKSGPDRVVLTDNAENIRQYLKNQNFYENINTIIYTNYKLWITLTDASMKIMGT